MMSSTPKTHTPKTQRGMALITSMLLLLVVTIMAVSMFRSYGTEERIAGNTRDKQRALNAAISAQQYAETQLAAGATPPTGVCVGPLLPNGTAVCSNPPLNLTTTPWTVGVIYAAFTSTSINGAANTVSTTTPTAGSYYAAPEFYITDLGVNSGSPAGEVYQIDALGYGGTQNTVALVESTFVVGSSAPLVL